MGLAELWESLGLSLTFLVVLKVVLAFTLIATLLAEKMSFIRLVIRNLC